VAKVDDGTQIFQVIPIAGNAWIKRK
jgi:hypothetical protein